MSSLLSNYFTISHELGDFNSFINPEEFRSLRSTSVFSDNTYTIGLQSGTAFIKNEIFNEQFELEFISYLQANIDSALDVVLSRITFSNKLFKSVSFKNKIHIHKNKNVYTYIDEISPIKSNNIYSENIIVSDLSDSKYQISLSFTINSITSGWNLKLYLRDEKGKWIIHLRLLPESGDIVTKNCTTWCGTRALPTFFNSLLNKSNISSYFLYRAENKPNGPIIRRIMNLCAYYIRPIKIVAHSKVSIRKL